MGLLCDHVFRGRRDGHLVRESIAPGLGADEQILVIAFVHDTRRRLDECEARSYRSLKETALGERSLRVDEVMRGNRFCD